MKFLLFSLVFSLQTAFAQQDPFFTQFWNVSTAYNPANSGLFYKHQAGLNYRNQWTNINGAPNTILTSYNAKLDKYKSGIGFNYMFETIGSIKQNRFDLNYSYHLDIGEEKKLAFGLSVGLENINFKSNWIAPSNIIDPLLPVNFSENILTSNFGITYKAKCLTLGLSSTKYVSVNLSDDKYSLAGHFYLNGSYDINLSENFTLKPQLLIRTDLIFSAIDINLLALYKKRYWIGLTSRNTETLCFMAGIDIKEKFRIGYSNDITFSKLNNGKTGGTHEIVLGFLLK